MLTARNVILATVIVAVVSVVAAVVSLMRPPGSDGAGGDSYGTRAHGQKALYDTLRALRVPVERSPIPPGGMLRDDTTLVLWGPHPKLVSVEPVYLRRVAEWVRRGGRVVVAPGRHSALLASWMPAEQEPDDEDEPATGAPGVLEELGLKRIDVTTADLVESTDDTGPLANKKPDSFYEIVEQQQAAMEVPLCTVPVRLTGAWRSLGWPVATLALPSAGLQVLNADGSGPEATLSVPAADGDVVTVAALYRVGQGEVVVVSDPRLAENRCIARDDNAVLAYHLLAPSGERVVFDEFYHGLTIRGNPLYLLARPPYGLMTLAVLLAVTVWIWRRAVALGPPLAPATASRRNIAEYLDAMARLFQRGRSSRAFLLREFRAGALWTLRRDLGLPPGREQPDELAAVLARRDPQRAEALRDALQTLDALLASDRRRPDDGQIVQALQRISACL